MKGNIILLLIIACFSTAGCNHAQRLPPGSTNSGLSIVSLKTLNKPLFIGKEENTILNINVSNSDSVTKRSLQEMILYFSKKSNLSDIDEIRVFCGSSAMSPEQYQNLGKCSISRNKIVVSGSYDFINGMNQIQVSFSVKKDADLVGKVLLENIIMITDDGSSLPVPAVVFCEYRFAKILRAAGQDNCNTYRIPGLVTTNSGTLIAVYDNRYNRSKDLQEDIDIGMSRSTDGGETWEPMKVIIDMGEYGGRPKNYNGTGDPCILYDPTTNIILVAALWMSGLGPDQTLWYTSKPGMSPEETGQFIVVKSTDDGITWSKPLNITSQIKDPSWQLLLQGPGRGLTIRNGTLVFPAQFKADIGQKALDGGQYICHSTIVYSIDGGNSWQIGTGAKTNTTESQVVELSDGSLMINMRDDRNKKDKSSTNGRAVAITTDMGRTWITHPSSNSALPEPNCQASLISADITISGVKNHVLFFSNPNNKSSRSNMTIKASLDDGMAWPEEYQVEINQEEGYGYSCLTMVDEKTIGILYEGVKDLYFQKIPVNDLFKGMK